MAATLTNAVCVNLGASDNIIQGFINVDLAAPVYKYDPQTNTTEMRADLRQAWPWPESSVDFFFARDIIEHLPDKIHTMNEAHRCLKAGGKIVIEVPTTDGKGAFQDPTHCSYWNDHSFWYYEKDNIYRERFAKTYGITAAFKIIGQKTDETPDGPKLTIHLEAVK